MRRSKRRPRLGVEPARVLTGTEPGSHPLAKPTAGNEALIGAVSLRLLTSVEPLALRGSDELDRAGKAMQQDPRHRIDSIRFSPDQPARPAGSRVKVLRTQRDQYRPQRLPDVILQRAQAQGFGEPGNVGHGQLEIVKALVQVGRVQCGAGLSELTVDHEGGLIDPDGLPVQLTDAAFVLLRGQVLLGDQKRQLDQAPAARHPGALHPHQGAAVVRTEDPEPDDQGSQHSNAQFGSNPANLTCPDCGM